MLGVKQIDQARQTDQISKFAKPTFAQHRAYVSFAAKARAQVRAAYGRYPLIGDRPGQCLVSDGFETRIRRADKAKPIQTKIFAIHTLGHVCAFSAPLMRLVCGGEPTLSHEDRQPPLDMFF